MLDLHAYCLTIKAWVKLSHFKVLEYMGYQSNKKEGCWQDENCHKNKATLFKNSFDNDNVFHFWFYLIFTILMTFFFQFEENDLNEVGVEVFSDNSYSQDWSLPKYKTGWEYFAHLLSTFK